MSQNVFIPKTQQMTTQGTSTASSPLDGQQSGGGGLFFSVAQYAVVLLIGLLPIVFTPGLWATLGFDKSLFTVVIGGIALVMIVFTALRHEKAKTIMPLSIGLFWLLALSGFVSAFLSGDTHDALRGSLLETQTATFIAVMALAMTMPLFFQGSKRMTMIAFMLFSGTAFLLLLHAVLRFIFGPDFLAFGSFSVATSSLIGGFNDLAIFAGLMVLLSLVTLAQLPLRPVLRYLLLVSIVLSLVILAVVNFFNIWLVIGFFAFLLLVYLIARDRLFGASQKQPLANARVLLTATALVCLVSAAFVVAGDQLGQRVGAWTGINFVEVRPSLEATTAIGKAVYGENALFGIGPNRFADAWRLHKDPAINATIFWDTDFNAGSGFVPTLFITFGLLGGLLIVAAHLTFLYTGCRTLLRSENRDPYWYFFAVLTFTAAIFLWGMSYVYVPGAGVLLLAALFTGCVFVATAALRPRSLCTIPLAVNRQRGFMLMGVAIFMISMTTAAVYAVGKQYAAQVMFAQAQAQSSSTGEFERLVEDAYLLYADDRFVSVSAQVQLGTLTQLLGTQQPTEQEQQQFLASAEKALIYAEQAIRTDMTNPDHHAVLASVYSNLALAGIDGANERSYTALAEAKRLDPQNPGYYLVGAQLAARVGDAAAAREELAAALRLKPNFTPALYLMAQLDIAEGKTESAIATTRAITQLEPTNPTRYYQLGILLAATDQLEAAITEYHKAIALDPQYANARYLLALAYLNSDRTELALEQLRTVQRTNSDNAQLNELIAQVESGEYEVPETSAIDLPVAEAEPQEGFADTVITESDVESDLITPVNAGAVAADEDRAAAPEESVAAEDTEEVMAVPVEETVVDESAVTE